MTWKLHADGDLSVLSRHNWFLEPGSKFVCVHKAESARRYQADCYGCGQEVTGEQLVAIFGIGPGLIEPEMVDAVLAGIFTSNTMLH